jgi:hypothetical protein
MFQAYIWTHLVYFTMNKKETFRRKETGGREIPMSSTVTSSMQADV